jgi:hypothetical protein
MVDYFIAKGIAQQRFDLGGLVPTQHCQVLR